MTIRLSGVPKDNAPSGGNDPLPEGRYDYIVGKAELGVSPTKGTPQISVWAKVIGGPYNNKTRIMNFYLTEASLWRLQEFLIVCGYPTPRADIEEAELVEWLEQETPIFSAFTEPNGKYNDYKGFGKPSSEGLKAVNAVPSAMSTNETSNNALDDLPF